MLSVLSLIRTCHGKLTALLMGVSLSACGQQSFDQKLAAMYAQTVPLIHPATLDSLQESAPVVLIDTRSPEEYAVSHLPQARFVNYDTFSPEDISDIPPDAHVVVYCAVGYRSERVGEELLQAGYRQVYNLYGGIFQWKNRGYSVVNAAGQSTDSVHTYNRRWSKWLERGVRVW